MRLFSRLLLAFLLIAGPASSQNYGPGGGGSGSGSNSGLTLATQNMTFNVSASGTGTACSVGTPCTFGTAVAQAYSYNWNNQFFPTISVANGTYAGVQQILPALLNCPNGGVLAFGTAVIFNDAGTNWTLTSSFASDWIFTGTLTLGGTFGGIDVDTLAQLNIPNLNLIFAGTLPNGGIVINSNGNVFGIGAQISTTTSSMGTLFFYRGFLILDNATITFTNPISFPSGNFVVAGDTTSGFFAFVGGSFVNPGNVTAAVPLDMVNGSFFEADSTSLSGGAVLSRSNFPGVSNGGAVQVDVFSTFQPDGGILGTRSGQFDISGSGSLVGFSVTNTGSGGHAYDFSTTSGAGSLGIAAGGGGLLDVTAGNLPYWFDALSNFNLWARLGWGASSNGTFTAPTIDTGLSRIGAAALALGNGTAGDKTGSLTLASLIKGGTVPTGTTGSCSATSFVGGATAGKFTAPLCAAGTIILSALPTAPNGYTCNAQDQTTVADLLQQSANTVTSVTFKATTALNDVVVFQCTGW
jgi:hypothetical protein